MSWKRQIKEYKIEFHAPFEVLIPANSYFLSVGVISRGIFPQDDHPSAQMWWMVEDKNEKAVKQKFTISRPNITFDVKDRFYLATFMYKGDPFFLFQFNKPVKE